MPIVSDRLMQTYPDAKLGTVAACFLCQLGCRSKKKRVLELGIFKVSIIKVMYFNQMVLKVKKFLRETVFLS